MSDPAWSVVVCRDDAPDDDISLAFDEAGAFVVPLPLMHVVVDEAHRAALTHATHAAHAAHAASEAHDVVAFTSKHAVRVYADVVGATPARRRTFAAVGAQTARAVAAAGLAEVREVIVGDAGGAVLARVLIARGVARVLHPRAEDAHAGLRTALVDAGVAVDDVACYRSVPRADVEAGIAAVWRSTSAPRAVVVTSPQRADLLLRALLPGDVVVVAIGATTAAALRAAGARVDAVAARPAPEAVVAAWRSGILRA